MSGPAISQTFWIARAPKMPVGRRSMNRMRMAKTTRSDHCPPAYPVA